MQKSEEGFELTWAVNVMAPFLLTSLLLDSISSRIVNVSSISAGSSLDFNNLQQVSVSPCLWLDLLWPCRLFCSFVVTWHLQHLGLSIHQGLNPCNSESCHHQDSLSLFIIASCEDHHFCGKKSFHAREWSDRVSSAG